MLGDYDVFELQLLRKQGKSLKAIAKETGYSINTVRKYARDFAKPSYRTRPNKPLKLDGYIDYLQMRVKAAQPHWIPATVLFEEIKARGYRGGLSLLRAYLSTLKPVVVEKPIIRFETKPGEQMQVDFAHFKYNQAKFYAFVALLGFSRLLYVEFVQNQQIQTLIQCHENAFDYFSGVPKYGLYDNMKTVIIKRHAYGQGQHRLHANFYDFAKHYGFIPKVCQPYRPQTKGKVERMISYLRYSFYHPFTAGKVCVNLTELNVGVMTWLNEVANQRVHATTQAVPFTQWQLERPYLQSIPNHYTQCYGMQTNTKSAPIALSSLPINAYSSQTIQHDLDVYDTLCQGGHQ